MVGGRGGLVLGSGEESGDAKGNLVAAGLISCGEDVALLR
jgi:hypothetical protein